MIPTMASTVGEFSRIVDILVFMTETQPSANKSGEVKTPKIGAAELQLLSSDLQQETGILNFAFVQSL